MPLYRINNRILLFAHIPKTGGSSVEAQLRRVAPEALNDLSYIKNRRNFSRCSAQHFHAPILDRIVQDAFVDYSFTIVRHPVARLKSEFRYRQFLKARYPRRWGRWIAQEPSEINAWVEHSFAEYSKNPFCYDNHLRPQHEFILGSAEIFHLENGLDAVFEKLSDITGTDISTPRKRHAVSLKSIETDMTPNTLSSVNAFYADDFAKLNFPD